jgi:hypothetical protein
MFEYIAVTYREIWRLAGRSGKSGKVFPYPLAVILYNGERPWSGPLKMGELIENFPGLPGDILDLPVFLVDLAKIPGEKIRGLPPVRALLSALRAASNKELGKRLEAILRMAVEEKEGVRRDSWLRALVHYYWYLEKPLTGLKAATRILDKIVGRKEAEAMATSLAEELIQ